MRRVYELPLARHLIEVVLLIAEQFLEGLHDIVLLLLLGCHFNHFLLEPKPVNLELVQTVFD